MNKIKITILQHFSLKELFINKNLFLLLTINDDDDDDDLGEIVITNKCLFKMKIHGSISFCDFKIISLAG
jgi:hypothetical protein